MAVKASTTATKVLAVLDAVARNQPIGVSALARFLDEDKGTVQRMLVTLAEEGWIKSDGAQRTKWSVTHRLRLLADISCGESDIIAIARPCMEELRDASGETVSLVLNDGHRFIVADVAESDALLRAAPRIGMAVPGPISASSLAILPYLPRARQSGILGHELTAEDEGLFEMVREAGFAIHESQRNGETVSIAAAVHGGTGVPIAIIVLTAPQARLKPAQQSAMGRKVSEAAQSLFRAQAGTVLAKGKLP